MVWDHFHKTFFFRRINCLKAGRNTLVFGFSFSTAELWTFNNSAYTFPILMGLKQKSSQRRKREWKKKKKKNSRNQDTRHMGLNKRNKFGVRNSSFRTESSTIILFCFQCWASQSFGRGSLRSGKMLGSQSGFNYRNMWELVRTSLGHAASCPSSSPN